MLSTLKTNFKLDLIQEDGLIISPFPEQIWVHKKCAEPECDFIGVALEYPNQPHDHYCWKHNPRVKEAMKS